MSSNLGRRLLKLTRRGVGLALALALMVPTLALAEDHRGPSGHGGGGYHGYTSHMPSGHRVVRYGGHSYYYHGGHYYRPYHGGYAWTRPPYGMRLGWLPIGAAAVILGGLTYYTLNDVYYQAVPGGYVVVEPPAGVVVTEPAPPAIVEEGPAPATAASGTVSVIPPTLNVRSGPGYGYPVLVVVNRGTVLVVRNVASGWYYVEVPGGQRGWVAQQYTTPLVSAGPNG